MEEAAALTLTLSLLGIVALNGLAVWAALNVLHSGSIFHRPRVVLYRWRRAEYRKEPNRSSILETILVDIRYLIAEMLLCRICLSVHLALWPMLLVGDYHWNQYHTWLVVLASIAVTLMLEELFPERALLNEEE